jgi:hypothetical protein
MHVIKINRFQKCPSVKVPQNNRKSKTVLLPLSPVVYNSSLQGRNEKWGTKRVSHWEWNNNYLLFAPFASLNLLVGERKQTTHCVRVPIVVNESVQSKRQGRGFNATQTSL